jgi:pimeloyl-ACP methyl ester carboxylesterase
MEIARNPRPAGAIVAALMVAATAAATAPAAGAQAVNTLEWKSCADADFERWRKVDDNGLQGFDCSKFVRPLNRSKPGGSKVTLAVVRLKATGPASEKKGTLFLNPGGPGQSGLGLSKIIYLVPEEVRQSYDFVTYDPRGIGASTPALGGRGCNIPKPSRPATGTVDWEKVLSERQEQVSRYNSLCFKGNRSLVENSGTIDGAYDLDAMRRAVGDEKLTYWGISYGTLLGSTYAQLFPGRVRGMIFDGNMDPQISLYGISSGSVAPDHSIGFFLQANGLRARFDEVMGRLNRSTLRLPSGYRYSRWDILDTLNNGVDFFPITGDPSWTQAKAAVTESWNALFGPESGRPAALKALESKELQTGSTGTAGSLWSAVVCQDFSDRISNSRQQHRLKWILREGPVYGGSLGVDYLTTCNGYGGAKPNPIPKPKRFGPPIPGIISNATRDGETPYQWAVNMARTYPTMRAITIAGGIHGTFGLSQSQCVDMPIANFLVGGTLPATDLACPYAAPNPAP